MRKRLAAFLAVVLMAALGTQAVAADGTEGLGTPSIAIADGTDVITAGTGTLHLPADINIAIPAGASIEQVLLYWEGQFKVTNDDTISINGNSVTGTSIGGPTEFFGARDPKVKSQTFRADISSLGLVSNGANVLTITDMDFDFANSGAGVLVIVDDGSSQVIELRDGNDLAFVNFDPTIDTTVPQTYTFDATDADRTATLDMFFSSVSGDASGAGDERPSSIEVESGGVTTVFSNILDSNDGEEWDTVELSVNVPAGATSITVQALSRDDNDSGNLPASFAWNAAALTLPVAPPDRCPPDDKKKKKKKDGDKKKGKRGGDDDDDDDKKKKRGHWVNWSWDDDDDRENRKNRRNRWVNNHDDDDDDDRDKKRKKRDRDGKKKCKPEGHGDDDEDEDDDDDDDEDDDDDDDKKKKHRHYRGGDDD